jgi:hypothetical protein
MARRGFALRVDRRHGDRVAGAVVPHAAAGTSNLSPLAIWRELRRGALSNAVKRLQEEEDAATEALMSRAELRDRTMEVLTEARTASVASGDRAAPSAIVQVLNDRIAIALSHETEDGALEVRDVLPSLTSSLTYLAAITIGVSTLGYIAYVSATAAATSFVELVCTAFDLFRRDLLRALDVEPPLDFAEERDVWRKLGQLMVYQQPPEALTFVPHARALLGGESAPKRRAVDSIARNRPAVRRAESRSAAAMSMNVGLGVIRRPRKTSFPLSKAQMIVCLALCFALGWRLWGVFVMVRHEREPDGERERQTHGDGRTRIRTNPGRPADRRQTTTIRRRHHRSRQWQPGADDRCGRGTLLHASRS